jgi:diguanylate cyclase (GGDEF)-like protein
VFGTEPRVRRPVVLILVFGTLLVLVGITATAQAVMVSAYASSSTLSSIVKSDVATVRGFVHDGLDGVDPRSADARTRAAIDRYLATLLAKQEIVHAEIRDVDGRVIASSDPAIVGAQRPASSDFTHAVNGAPKVAIVPEANGELDGVDLPPTVLREYLPLRRGEQTLLVMAIWRDAGPILAQLDDLRRDVVVVILTAALIAAAVLYVVFRTAQATITRQTAALIRSTRLDALTESLNHGAVVGQLAADIERARVAGSPLGVALLDIDNFRLLNDNHGHRAGDDVLLVVAEAIESHLTDGVVMGRYGPDEFLLVAGQAVVADLEPTVDRIRTALADRNLQFEATERLPITLSAGICTFPDHGESVTELLSAVAATLQEAKASGGDSVVVAGTERSDEQASAATFDVFEGLIIAVDTKDRYTKRHCEDVARYGTFIAEQLGLDAAVVSSIRTAGLLHDVGKIGIPDAILRKPGRLTAAEYEVVKQHVALGDMILRDLPDVERIRAGVRHHHERWDGTGYLEALAGDDIPLIARILAVGDAFSAMTTTRPYRKAFDVQEALVRLGDAAGTQLDESLVAVFITGIESIPGAPMPMTDGPPARWRRSRRVA